MKRKMRTIACKTVWTLLVGVSLALSLNSCSKEPVIPENETENKLHEDPARMTVRLVECHLHADWNEIQKAGRPQPESGISCPIYETHPGNYL